MRLFSKDEPPIKLDLSLEYYKEYFNDTTVISTESITDYFYKIKDLLNTSVNTIFNLNADKIFNDVNSSKYEVIHICKKFNFANMAENIVSKPEGFKGFYVDYANDLLIAAKYSVEASIKILEQLSTVICYYINDYKEDNVYITNIKSLIKTNEKTLIQNKDKVQPYFKHNSATTKTPFKSVFRRMGDVELIYANIASLNEAVSIDKLANINKLATNCSELVDVLIDMNTKSNGKLINDAVRTDLTNATYLAANQVEFAAYVYSSIVNFYGVFYNTTEEIKLAYKASA